MPSQPKPPVSPRGPAKPAAPRGPAPRPQTSPVITRAQNGVITARLKISNTPVRPVAKCPAPGSGLGKFLGGAASVIEKGYEYYGRAEPFLNAFPRAKNAFKMAKTFGGPNSPLKAAAVGGLRNIGTEALSTGLKKVGGNVLKDAAVGGLVGGMKSAASNVVALKSKQISPANFAGRVGHGVAQGAVKEGAKSAVYAGGGALAGAAIGAGVGALFGGVGAVPGAVVGAKVGAFVGPIVGPMFDKAAGGHVGRNVDKLVDKVLPSEAAFGRAADRAAGAVGGAVSGALTGISKGLGAASRFLPRW